MWTAGDVAGSIYRLLVEPDTMGSSTCGSADVQGALFSAKMLDIGVGTALGWSSEREVGAGDVYNG